MLRSLKPFYFLRHGETDWNRNGIYMGQKDVPLNEAGILQAQEVAKILQHRSIKHIVTSSLSRAKMTAEIINDSLKINMTVIDGLKECAWGIYEGQPVQDNLLEKWLNGEIWAFAEPLEVFENRILKAFLEVLTFDEPVLIVAHGGSYLALQRHLKVTLTRIRNCSLVYHCPPKQENLPWFVADLTANDDEYEYQ